LNLTFQKVLLKITQKIPIKERWPEPFQGRPKKGQKTHSPKGPKRKRESFSLSFLVESYFTHGPSNATSMQIMRSNNKPHFKLKNLLTLVNFD
jgi:hypothetical protein